MMDDSSLWFNWHCFNTVAANWRTSNLGLHEMWNINLEVYRNVKEFGMEILVGGGESFLRKYRSYWQERKETVVFFSYVIYAENFYQR